MLICERRLRKQVCNLRFRVWGSPAQGCKLRCLGYIKRTKTRRVRPKWGCRKTWPGKPSGSSNAPKPRCHCHWFTLSLSLSLSLSLCLSACLPLSLSLSLSLCHSERCENAVFPVFGRRQLHCHTFPKLKSTCPHEQPFKGYKVFLVLQGGGSSCCMLGWMRWCLNKRICQ